MKPPTLRILAATLTCLIAGPVPLRADETPPKAPALTVGSAAPSLQPGKWAQGEPVKEFAKGKAYLVEFWATWCGPCRTSIPHLNEIHKRYADRGLVVIGQNVWERNETLVEPFLKKMGPDMSYRVALDDKSRSEKGAMAETWMEAAGQDGIPAAFLVDTQGKVAWIGHPMELKDPVLEAVLAGTFNVARAAEEYQTRRHNEAAANEAYRELTNAMRNEDWDQAQARLDKVARLMGPESRDNLASSQFRIHVGRRDEDAAYRVAADLSDRRPDEPMLQNELAWQILTAPGLNHRDIPLAEKIATRANRATNGKNPAVLDTLARAVFLAGRHDQAIEYQKAAVDLADKGSELRKNLEATLASYRSGKVPGAE